MSHHNNHSNQATIDFFVEGGLAKWKPLFRIAGIAAIAMLVLIPVQIVVYSIWPTPKTILKWFELLGNTPILGLLHLDLLYIINNTIVAVLYLALYMILRRKNESLMLIALVLGLMGMTAYYSSNSAFEMLSLSKQYNNSVTAAEQAILLASGQSMIELWKGTAFGIYYILNGFALLIIAGVMYKSQIFGKSTSIIGLVSGILMMIPSTAGTVGLVFSLASLVPWYVFSILIAKKFFHLSRMNK